MAKVTFVGVNASGYVAYWGYHFPCGEVIEAEGEAVEGARRHPEFSVEEDSGVAAENINATAKPKPRRKYARRKKA